MRHASKEFKRRVARGFLFVGLSLVLFVASFGAFAYYDLQSQITAIDPNNLLGTDRPSRDPAPDGYEGHAVNILVLGTDSRAGANNVDGSEGNDDVVVARSDTAMIMHISADRSRVDVISIPRDTVVDIPSCTSSDGSTVEESEGQFNTAFANGAGTGSDKKAVTAGVACTIKTVEALTDIYIDESIVVDFSGLSTMVDALGGVTLYVDEDIDDTEYTGLVLERGCHHLDGATALQYARVRHGVGDGSDISRISRQQNLMSAMLRAAQAKNLLTDADELYSFAREALGTLTTSKGIADLTTLAGLAQSIANIGMDHINFVTMPHEPADWDPDRVVPSESADAVWEALKTDKPVPADSTHADGTASTPTASASGTPSSGSTPDDSVSNDSDPDDSSTDEESSAIPTPPGAKPTDSKTATATQNPAEQCR